MSKRTVFTTVTPLPAGITRRTVLETLYAHVEMIDLNPLVEERHPIKPPPNATAEEYHCVWYSLTDRVQYLPGGLCSGKVSYTACFHDLPSGLQTHVYAPMGLNIKDKWTIGGSLPGEPVEPVEMGLGAPLQGLYLREDVDMKCNIVMTNFVKKTLKKAHAALVDRLVVKAQIIDASEHNTRLTEKSLRSPQFSQYGQRSPSFHGSDHGLDSSSVTSYNGPPTPDFRGPGSPEFRDKSLYPEALSIRSSSASYNGSMTGGRVSWSHLLQNQRSSSQSPSMRGVDPAYQKANPYDPRHESIQSYQAVELPSHLEGPVELE